MAVRGDFLVLWLALAIPTIAALASSPSAHLHAGRNSCFTSDCEHHTDFALCITGQYACNANQFCQLQGNADGTMHMKCEGQEHLITCLDRVTHNLAVCTSAIQAHCQYCCHDADCVRGLAHPVAVTHSPAATTTAPATQAPLATAAPLSTEAPLATAAPLSTEAPLTTQAPLSTETPSATQAPVATEVPLASTTADCVDTLSNNDCSHLLSDCSDIIVREACRETCDVCSSSNVVATAVPLVG